MKKFFLLFTLLVSLLMVTTSTATVINVSVDNFFFSPSSFDAAVGDTVTWTLINGFHTTTSTSVPFGASSWDYTFAGAGDTYSYVITVAGVYEYLCMIHPTLMIASFSTSVPFPFVEDFDFPAGDNLTFHGWTAHSSGGTNPQTVDVSGLTFTNYPSSGIGNSALLDNTSEDTHRLFDEVTSGTVYYSLMVKVDAIATGYFIHLAPNPHNTFDFRARLWITGTGSNYGIGLSYASSDTLFTPHEYITGTTYLCVVKYEVVDGTQNDIASLYVFDETDPFPGTEPVTPTVGPILNTTTSADINPGSINLRQYSSSQNIVVDGIRIGNTWAGIVPVELTSFTANVKDGAVVLNWQTATETNNSGFEIERKSSNQNWIRVGFVEGNGTTTEKQYYSFTDKNINSGNYSYRLKQLDFNGAYEYSKTVEVEVVEPNKYELVQNYPNPFNPSTTIEFTIPQASKVSLKVYNLLGQEVRTLVNGIKDAGTHKINFDAKELNSGMYIYKIEAGSFTQVRKMTLLK